MVQALPDQAIGAGGLDEMMLFDGQGRCGYLGRWQETALSTWLSERLMRDRGEVAACIAATWAVIYGRSGCLKLPHHLGFE